MPRRYWSFFMPVEDHMFMKRLIAYHHARFTTWGKIVFWMVFLGSAIASPGTHISAYLLPSFIIAFLIVSSFLSFFFRPKVTAKRVLPSSVNAGGHCIYTVIVKNIGKRPIRNLAVFESMLPYGLYAGLKHPKFNNTIEWLEPGEEARATLVIDTPQRGIYELENLLIGSSFPSGLLRIPVKINAKEKFVVYPKFTTQSHFILKDTPLYQPGGISESSKAGDSNEFLSTRDFRYGDRLRDVHWASTARANKLIVKEYIEEYIVRTCMVLDTQWKKGEKPKNIETRISLLAGVASSLNHRSYVIDVFTTDEKIPPLTVGRSITEIDHLLEMLSCLEGDYEVNFDSLLIQLRGYLPYLSSIIIFLKDWDQQRSSFVNALKAFGVHIRVIVVGDKKTTIEPPKEITVVSSDASEELII